MFSILICSFNKSRSLQAVLTNLNHLVKDNNDSLFEVVVVVDGSTDNTIDSLKKIQARYPFSYYYIENSGLAQARNYGIDKCAGEYIICCDDDVLMDSSYIENLSLAVKQRPLCVHIGNLINVDKKYSPEIVDNLIGGKNIDYSSLSERQYYHIFFEAAKKLFCFQDRYEDFNPAAWWAVVTGGNLCIPKQYFNSFGKFDDNFKSWGPEDADLCYRFFKNGVRAFYNNNCLLYHLDHDRNPNSLLESMTKNAVYFIKKYKKPRELYEYLNFTNGKTSLLDFNNLCSDLFNIKKVEVPSFSMSMKDYSGRDEFIKYTS